MAEMGGNCIVQFFGEELSNDFVMCQVCHSHYRIRILLISQNSSGSDDRLSPSSALSPAAENRV